MLPPASALRLNSSLLASLFVASGLCFLRLAGHNSAGGSSSPNVASSFLRRIKSFHTSTERSKNFKLSRCLLSADGSFSPYQSTGKFKVMLHKLSLFLWQSLHYRNQHLNSLLAVRRCTYSHCRWAEFQASRKYFRIQLALEQECSFEWLLLPPTSAPMLFDRDPIPLNLYLGATLQFFQSLFCIP